MHSLFKDPRPEAALILSDGTVLLGRSFGASVSNVAEVVFNTAMTGYQEVLTDPSYTGQIVTLTGAHVGNVGVNAQDREGGAAVHAAGLVVRDVPAVHSNFRSEKSLPDYLVEQGVPAIAGGWVELNATADGLIAAGIPNGQEVLIVIGEGLEKEKIEETLKR